MNTASLAFYRTHNRMLQLGNRLQGRHYTASELTKNIRRQFDTMHYIVRTNRDYAVDPDSVVVSGLYDSHNDRAKLPAMELTLSYHPEQALFYVDQINWPQLAFDIAECTGHELVHKMQSRKRNRPGQEYASASLDPKRQADQEYLGTDDEIEAYGFSIAAESHMLNRAFTECAMYLVYQETFDNDAGVILKLQQQVEVYKKQLESVNE